MLKTEQPAVANGKKWLKSGFLLVSTIHGYQLLSGAGRSYLSKRRTLHFEKHFQYLFAICLICFIIA